jgi:fumarylpyruvate hydrolase
MSSYLIHPPETVSLPVLGCAGHFPVRRLFCVGQNYADHAVEMGSDPSRQKPFFFCKAREALVHGGPFVYPTYSQDVQHEIELVVALARGGSEVRVEQSLEMVFGYAVGLDMTRRDLQAEAKKAGRPWESAKSFDGSAPCSSVVAVDRCGHPERGEIWLDVNGQRRQTGDLAQMIWKVPEIIAELSKLFRLHPGDLIFTGTPSGVGPVLRGDIMRGGVAGVTELEVCVT